MFNFLCLKTTNDKILRIVIDIDLGVFTLLI